MDTHSLKLKFAAALLQFDEPYKAALAILPDDPGMALQIARQWLVDPTVEVEKSRLMSSHGSKSFLPSKDKQLKDIYLIATNDKECAEDRLKAHRLYAEISGFIAKPTAGGGMNILNQGVMIVKDQGSNAEWEEKTMRQQRDLIGHADAIN